MHRIGVAAFAVLVAFGLSVGAVWNADARQGSARHCAEDYRRFCSQWGINTRGLKNLHARRRSS